MPVLKSRKVWRREPPPREADYVNALTLAEQENVRAALGVLRRRYGTLKALAKAMGIPHRSLTHMVATGRKPTAGVALRVARAADATIDDVLSGKFVKPRACPTCGRAM